MQTKTTEFHLISIILAKIIKFDNTDMARMFPADGSLNWGTSLEGTLQYLPNLKCTYPLDQQLYFQ